MTTIQSFIKAKDDDIFTDLSSGEMYRKEQIEAGFQDISCQPVTTVKEYHERLKEFLQGFRKTSEADG